MKFYTNVYEKYNKILVRGYENGKRINEQIEYKPTFYIRSKRESKYKTLDGKSVEPITPGGISDCRQFFKKYEGIEGFDICGMENYTFQYISDNYPQNEIEYDISKIKICTIDIETSSEYGFASPFTINEEILLISIQNFNTKHIITFGSRPFENNRENATYVYCKTEVELISKFLEFWESDYPDIITGWNVNHFDLPYITKRIDRILGDNQAKRLSPWKSIKIREIEISGQVNLVCEIPGITCLDYLSLYKKFTYTNRESYKLDFIAEVELDEKKLDHSKYETFREFYTKDFQLFTEYNRVDCELVDKLEQKLKLIELCIMISYRAKINYNDVFSPVKIWDAITYNYLKPNNIVIPQKKYVEKDEKFSGAFVKEPIPGMYDYVVSFDIASLYPSIMMMFNQSPETLLDERHPNINIESTLNQTADTKSYSDYAICPNGCMYRKDIRGVFPELIEIMFNERKIYKKKKLELEIEYEKTNDPSLINSISKYDLLQQNLKIFLNGLYGCLGTPYFRYYRLDNAVAVTSTGQAIIKWIESKLNEYINGILKTPNRDWVLGMDTDSCFLHLGAVVDKIFENKNPTKLEIINFLDNVCAKSFQKVLDTKFDEFSNYLNAYKNTLYMKRETISDRAIWTKKKRYILNVWDNEGVRYESPRIKIKGLEAVKSSTPAVCRKMIKDAVPIMMNQTENDMIEYIKYCKNEFFKYTIEEISFPRSANNLDTYGSNREIYKKGTPMHVRGALLYNYHIKKNKLDHKYPIVQNGEKVKYCALQLPNPIHEGVISFVQYFPKELGLDTYVDYNTQFNKAFLDPLKNILDAIGWRTEKTVNLANFYS